MNNQTDVSIRFSNSVTGEKKLEKYKDTLSQINAVLKGMDTGAMKSIDQVAKGTKSTNEDIKDISRRTKAAFNYNVVTKFAYGLKRVVSTMSSLTKQSFDYLENFNLMQVAYNGSYEAATKFVNKMAEMYGLDENWLIRTTGNFKQLTNAMNLTEETGSKVAQLLTQMSVDISSLYNVDFSRAASILSSAMAGQTKPVRGTTGADITQATLQTTLDRLGVDRQVAQLSYAEKRLLIIISLTQQLRYSVNDLGRTIESPSNQTRILADQWERLMRAFGNVFMPILSKVLPYLNAIMMVLVDIVNLVASLMGYKEEDFDYFDKIDESAWDLSDGLEQSTENAKKLKQGLRGFDKLNVITTPTKAGGGASATGLDPKILDAFNKSFENYQKQLDNIEMKATKIKNALEDWLGITDGTYTNLKLIGAILGGLAIAGLIKSFATLSGLVNGVLGRGTAGVAGGTGVMGLWATLGLIAGVYTIIVALQVNEEYNKTKQSLEETYNIVTNLNDKIDSITKGFLKQTPSVKKNSKEVSGMNAQYKLTNRQFGETIDLLLEQRDSFKKVGGVAGYIKSVTFGLTGGYIRLNSEITDNIDTAYRSLKSWQLLYEQGKLNDAQTREYKNALKNYLDTLDKVIQSTDEQWLKEMGLESSYNATKKQLEKLNKETEKQVTSLDYMSLFINDKGIPSLQTFTKNIDKLKTGEMYLSEETKNNLIKNMDSLAKKFGLSKDKAEKLKDEIKSLPTKKDIDLNVNTKETSTKSSDSKAGLNNILAKIEKALRKFSLFKNLSIPRFATGMPFVPNDFYPAYLDYGERVLTKEQNRDYMNNMNNNAVQNSTPINGTFIIQVGNEELTRVVINNLQEKAKTNGKAIRIGG